MPLINLIQEQRLAKKRIERQARTAFFSLVGVGILSAGGFMYFTYEKDRMRAEETRLETDIQKMQPLLSQIDANKKLLADLKPRLDTLDEAQKATDRWCRILAHLTKQTPKATWLTGLRSLGVEGDKPIVLTLNGTSPAQEPIGEFILRVGNQPDLENVNLHYTQEKVSNDGKAIDFEMAADIQGTAVKKTKEDKAGEGAKS